MSLFSRWWDLLQNEAANAGIYEELVQSELANIALYILCKLRVTMLESLVSATTLSRTTP